MPKLNRRPNSIVANEEDRKIEEQIQNITHQQNKQHWDVIISSGPGVCFVCDKKIKSNGVYVGKHALNGKHIYRHAKCCSGSENWEKKFHGHVDEHMKKINKKEE